MSTTRSPQRPLGRFLAGFALVALLVAGGVSYLASGSPDGLDSATLQGCTVVDGEITGGTCIAQDEAAAHPTEDSPLAGYTLGGDEGLKGVSGVLGVVATFALAGGVFWLVARSRRDPRPPEQP